MNHGFLRRLKRLESKLHGTPDRGQVETIVREAWEGLTATERDLLDALGHTVEADIEAAMQDADIVTQLTAADYRALVLQEGILGQEIEELDGMEP